MGTRKYPVGTEKENQIKRQNKWRIMTAAKAVHNSPFIIICIYRQPDRL